jgi:dCMP deaminase
MTEKWDLRFIELAKQVASWSHDPSTKVGSVITDGKRVVSLGYNGFPCGVLDSDDRLNDRELKYKLTVHAETNAVLFANRDLRGLTIYNWPFMPCSACAGAVIQAGIKRVVAPVYDNPRWVESFNLSKQMFTEAGVEVKLYEL